MISLVFTNYHPPHFAGGIERYLDEVGRRLLRRGIACEVVAFDETQPSTTDVPIRYVPVLRRVPFAPVLSFALRTWGTWRDRPRVVVQYAQLALSVPSDRLYCIVHTTSVGEARSQWQNAHGLPARLEALAMRSVGARLERAAFARARGLVAISEAIKRELVEDYGVPQSRVTVIGTAVDCQAFHPPAERVVSARPGLKLLCVGRLVPRKNLGAVLHALPHCDEAVTCEVVGEGPQRAELTALATRLGLQSRVHFTGAKQGAALLQSYQQADLFVMPSSYEGMPLVVLEAKACGLPTVAANFPGARELIPPSTGSVLDALGPRELGAVFNALLHDPPRLAAMRDAARADALSRFDWDKVLDALIAALELS